MYSKNRSVSPASLQMQKIVEHTTSPKIAFSDITRRAPAPTGAEAPRLPKLPGCRLLRQARRGKTSENMWKRTNLSKKIRIQGGRGGPLETANSSQLCTSMQSSQQQQQLSLNNNKHLQLASSNTFRSIIHCLDFGIFGINFAMFISNVDEFSIEFSRAS